MVEHAAKLLKSFTIVCVAKSPIPAHPSEKQMFRENNEKEGRISLQFACHNCPRSIGIDVPYNDYSKRRERT